MVESTKPWGARSLPGGVVRIITYGVATISRQRRWQLQRISEGLCGVCGDRPLVTTDRCAECHEGLTVRRRERLGQQPWEPGKRGRPPKYRKDVK